MSGKSVQTRKSVGIKVRDFHPLFLHVAFSFPCWMVIIVMMKGSERSEEKEIKFF